MKKSTAETIAYAIKKECQSSSLYDWCDSWDITTDEFDEFLALAVGNAETEENEGKQIPKKPIMKQYFEDLEDEYLCCPTCGEILTDRIPADNKTFYFHCMNCGQKFDWSDEE